MGICLYIALKAEKPQTWPLPKKFVAFPFMVNLNSKLYAKAFSDKWLGSLAVYAKLQQLHSGKKFYFGPAFRFSNRLDKTSLEAIMLTIGYDFKGLNLGLSYDYNTTDLFNDRYGMSTFEVSINYFGQYENADAFCPTF